MVRGPLADLRMLPSRVYYHEMSGAYQHSDDVSKVHVIGKGDLDIFLLIFK